MRKTRCQFFSLLAVSISIVFALPLHAQQAPEKKIWDGVFTSNQALRGKSAFEGVCARCHNIALVGSERGPAIKGPAFLSHWTRATFRISSSRSAIRCRKAVRE